MSIDVFWTYDIGTKESIRAEDPVDILKKFLVKDDNFRSDYASCPTVRDHLKNLYGFRHIFDVKFHFDITNSIVNIEKKKFDLKDRFLVRSFDRKLFSFPCSYIFFTEKESLEVEMLPAYLEDNDVVNKTIMIPGKFDIGKWIRPLDFAFHLKQDYYHDILSFNRKDIIYYLHFKTSEKINFKYFHHTPEIKFMTGQLLDTRNFKNQKSSMRWFYNIFSKRGFKKRIINQIKENLA